MQTVLTEAGENHDIAVIAGQYRTVHRAWYMHMLASLIELHR
jgi:hypothetical protein